MARINHSPRKGTDDLDIKEGISLLSLRHQVMLNYLHALALLSAHRVLGHSLQDRTPPTASFQDPTREPRGSQPGDLVDSLIENRLVLEKSKALEARMHYQIEKLVRSAAEPASTNEVEGMSHHRRFNVVSYTIRFTDPLSFRPNPDNLVQNEAATRADSEDANNDGIYHPPKVAPIPYIEKGPKEKRRGRVPAALASLAYQDAYGPHAESTSGLGGAGNRGINAVSSRARELARMTEYEEANMTRLVMNKKEAKRRRRDEENIALGGTGLGSHTSRGRARGANLADEFGDLLRDQGSRRGMMDEYEELRSRSKKKTAFERSKVRESAEQDHLDDEERPRKRSRFHQEIKKSKRRSK
jgi:U3 small nucleolar ribonucleoprotein protein LCP5